jgi:NADPH-dependent 2,4-dienoyl-CoA reductase/sulfur reductase-like enzyme
VTDVRDVIIIGSGPAGYTAAIYAARAKLTPLVFEGSVTAGGALMQTTDVENFPGFPDGIMGPDLMDHLRKQAERFGAELVADDAIEVDLTVSPKVVKTESETYLAKAVIIATGSKYKSLDVPGEKELSGHGVSFCATCDGFFFREQDIAVIGGGAVPHPVRQVRDDRAPARQAARFEDHGGAGGGQPQDQVPVGQRAGRDGGRGQAARPEDQERPQRRGDDPPGRRRVHRDRPLAPQRAVRRPAADHS